MNKIIFLIVLTTVMVSCRSVITRNLTGRIELDEIEENNDTVDFYIKQIELFNVERLKKYSWGEDTPGFNLEITITNKLNTSIYLMSTNWDASYFLGILPPESNSKKDTVYFVNFSDNFPGLLEPKSSISFGVSSFYPLYIFCDETQLDNTEPMLDLVKRLKFYYAPLPIEKNMGQDTIVINSTHRLRTDASTKITSWSRIR